MLGIDGIQMLGYESVLSVRVYTGQIRMVYRLMTIALADELSIVPTFDGASIEFVAAVTKSDPISGAS